jgi:quinol monooxygenase YgiN
VSASDPTPAKGSGVVGRFGALLELTAKPGRRDELVRIVTNYSGTLDGEPGTLLFAVATDATDPHTVFLWEAFADDAAVQAHFEHDFFRALSLELAELLVAPASVRPLVPVAHRVNPGVVAE